MKLFKNQNDAIQTVIKNNFESGIIAHATGTGKSVTGINIILEYIKRCIATNIFWICEYKFILKELFLNDKFKSIIELLNIDFNILDFSIKKDKNWVNIINTSDKPCIVFINRAFLTSQEKYKNLVKPINFIIHDECHSIKNKTTTNFYSYLKEYCPFNVIGLSATPLMKYPFEKIIHSYTLYNALCDKTIVSPQIVWFTKEKDITIEEVAIEIKKLMEQLIYKKIIVWCGLISVCNDISRIWSRYFDDYTICIDTSQSDSENNFDTFKNCESKAFLFCAAKHREGSDIKNLDCCIFMDKVSKRTPKTFLQCVGRVLRVQKDKKQGLIVDIKAKSAYDVIKRMAIYLNNDNTFPYSYSYNYNHDSSIKINNLMIKDNNDNILNNNDNNDNDNNNNDFINSIGIEELKSMMKREMPNNEIYKKRFDYEIKLLIEKDLLKYINFAMKILELTQDIPHVTRGSCGSSLVCYLLGITHVDPVKYNIKFERFLNIYRNNLPDIDFDFPHNSRDEIFYRLEKTWPGKIARISNHVHYHEKSAKRAVLKEMGYNHFIAKYEIEKAIRKLPANKISEFNQRVKNLENKFRMYSLHCGGIVFYPDGVPDYLKHISKNQSVINQITLNKYDISSEKKFKIDILSSRALSQLVKVDKSLAFKDFNKISIDENVMNLFRKGENIGITLAESPLIKKAMVTVSPKNISDLSLILAIIRPAAKESNCVDFNKDCIIYDDDAIDLIAKYCNVPFDKADYYRRNINKDKKITDEMYNLVSKSNKKTLEKKLENLNGYGFCKAHSYSYAELIYKLAYIKYYYPTKFWEATLKNCETSYRKWVHLYEAHQCKVDFSEMKLDTDSVYAKSKNNLIYKLDHTNHFQKFGIWNLKLSDFYPNCYGYINNDNYHFKGIIAQIKVLNKIIIYFICVGQKKYIEIVTDNNKSSYKNFKSFGIKGVGKLQESYIISVQSKFYKFF